MLKATNFILLCAIITKVIDATKLNQTYDTGENRKLLVIILNFVKKMSLKNSSSPT